MQLNTLKVIMYWKMNTDMVTMQDVHDAMIKNGNGYNDEIELLEATNNIEKWAHIQQAEYSLSVWVPYLYELVRNWSV